MLAVVRYRLLMCHADRQDTILVDYQCLCVCMFMSLADRAITPVELSNSDSTALRCFSQSAGPKSHHVSPNLTVYNTV